MATKTDLVKIDKPFDQLEVMHIDTLAAECGMFTGDTVNNSYGCLSKHNTETPGCCHTFSCPIATEIDEDEPEWDEGYDGGEWMKQHSEFREAR